jgi:hypothetical protein
VRCYSYLIEKRTKEWIGNHLRMSQLCNHELGSPTEMLKAYPALNVNATEWLIMVHDDDDNMEVNLNLCYMLISCAGRM